MRIGASATTARVQVTLSSSTNVSRMFNRQTKHNLLSAFAALITSLRRLSTIRHTYLEEIQAQSLLKKKKRRVLNMALVWKAEVSG